MPERGPQENIAATAGAARDRVLSRRNLHDSLSRAGHSAREDWMKVRIEWCKP
jgi:hypothetical protein